MSRLAHSSDETVRAIELNEAERGWREGDVYVWRYNDAAMEKHRKGFWGGMDPYHCCSRTAVVKGGDLLDTFWHLSGDGTRRWTKEEASERLVIEYKGNLGELVPINSWETDYYEPSDLVDMRHSNSSNEKVYRRPEATRSKARLVEFITYKIERAQSDIRSANWTIEKLNEALAKIESGVDLQEISP